MLRDVSEILGYHMAATDGEIGTAHDVLFDDHAWTIRHLVVDTGKWLPGRRVLIAPEALEQPDWKKRVLAVGLTKEQIENSPSIDEDKPVSRQQEMELFRYYAWTPYWGPTLSATYPEPAAIAVPADLEEENEVDKGDPHLRSVLQVKGYHIAAADGDIGHIEGFIVDDESWSLRYAIVDTRNWLPGKKVLISPWWLRAISWVDRKATTDLTRDSIKHGPAYDPALPINREYEERLYDFHGRPKYWVSPHV